MMRVVMAIIAVVCLGGALLTAGTAPLGRVALALGMNDIAALAFSDPAWRGVAAYRAGRFEEAARLFEEAGGRSDFNLGNAQAQMKSYAAALEAYDRAQLIGDDPDAEANFELVMALYGKTEIEAGSIVEWFEDKEGDTVAAETAQGSTRAAGTGDAVTNTSALIGQIELESRGRKGVRKVFDDKFVVASDRWLATLDDIPGAYLAARISHEHKRRKKAGIGQPKADSPW